MADDGMIRDWPELRDFALSLELPEVTLAYPFGNEALNAFGRMWCYWGRSDGAVFRADKLEREFLMQADPGTFFLHPHYAPYDLVLVRAGRIDRGWARARLIAQWRAAAPKRFLKAWDVSSAGRDV